jgi:tellurite resistance protein TerC
MAVEWWVWAGFGVFVVGMLLLDLLVFHRRAHVVSLREALGWSAFWIAVGLAFGAGVWFLLGPGPGLEYYTGYLIEKSLSVDNLFVFLLIFAYFSVPREDEHKVLFYGILGALVFRGIFIFVGVALIEQFHWVLYIFGAILIVSAVRIAIRKEEEIHPERNPVLRLVRRVLPVAPDYHGAKFFVRIGARLVATPLLVVLVVVETTDIVFAIDSVPAIFAITLDPFIIYTSNAFAILGLRALYFALAGALQRLYYLHYGLAVVLAFVGVKIFIADFYKIPVEYALATIGVILLATTAASLARSQGAPKTALGPSAEASPGGTRSPPRSSLESAEDLPRSSERED